MPRYILIDQYSGFIWGDSADFSAVESPTDPIDAAHKLDASIKNERVKYETTNQNDASAKYHIHDASNDQVPPIWDGQDQNTINEVVRLCPYVTSLKETLNN